MAAKVQIDKKQKAFLAALKKKFTEDPSAQCTVASAPHDVKHPTIVPELHQIKQRGHTIMNYELDSIMAAAETLFCPQDDGKSDPRSAYQRIYYTVHEIKERTW